MSFELLFGLDASHASSRSRSPCARGWGAQHRGCRPASGPRAPTRCAADRALLVDVATQAMFVSCIAGALFFLAPYLAERSDLSSTAVDLSGSCTRSRWSRSSSPWWLLMTGRSRVAGLFAASAVLAIALLGYGMAGLFDGITALHCRRGGHRARRRRMHARTHSGVAVQRHRACTSSGATSRSADGLAGGRTLGPAVAGLIFAAQEGAVWPTLATMAFGAGLLALTLNRVLRAATR